MSTYVKILDDISIVLSTIGVFIVLFGGIVAAIGYINLQLKEVFRKQKSDYTDVKNLFIQKILLSLDFFVGSDLIRSIASPNFAQVGLLAAIVAIRIALSFSLSRELKPENTIPS